MTAVLAFLLVVGLTVSAHANLIVEIHQTEDGVVAPDDLEIYASATVSSQTLRNRPPGILTVPFTTGGAFVSADTRWALVLRSTEEGAFWLGDGVDPYELGHPVLRNREENFWRTQALALIDFGFAICVRPLDALECVDGPAYFPDLEDVTVAGIVSPTVDLAQVFTVTHTGVIERISLLIAGPAVAQVPNVPTWLLLGVGLVGMLGFARGRQ